MKRREVILSLLGLGAVATTAEQTNDGSFVIVPPGGDSSGDDTDDNGNNDDTMTTAPVSIGAVERTGKQAVTGAGQQIDPTGDWLSSLSWALDYSDPDSFEDTYTSTVSFTDGSSISWNETDGNSGSFSFQQPKRIETWDVNQLGVRLDVVIDYWEMQFSLER